MRSYPADDPESVYTPKDRNKTAYQRRAQFIVPEGPRIDSMQNSYHDILNRVPYEQMNSDKLYESEDNYQENPENIYESHRAATTIKLQPIDGVKDIVGNKNHSFQKHVSKYRSKIDVQK